MIGVWTASAAIVLSTLVLRQLSEGSDFRAELFVSPDLLRFLAKDLLMSPTESRGRATQVQPSACRSQRASARGSDRSPVTSPLLDFQYRSALSQR